MKTYRSLAAVQDDLKNGYISCHSLTKAYLNRISGKKHLNAFLEVFEAEFYHAPKLLMKKLQRALQAV